MPSKIAISATVAAALLACNVHAADRAIDSHPVSTPTHAVPVKPTIKGETEDETTGASPTQSTDRLTIKTKSSPPVAPLIQPADRLTIKTKSSPPYAPPIEDKKTQATTTTSGD
jgi:hypothetical protein